MRRLGHIGWSAMAAIAGTLFACTETSVVGAMPDAQAGGAPGDDASLSTDSGAAPGADATAPALDAATDTAPPDVVAPVTCDSGGACAPGAQRSVPCGMCGTRAQTCNSACLWENQACTGEGTCNPGDTEQSPQGCQGSASRVRTCSSACAWDSWSACGIQQGWRRMSPLPAAAAALINGPPSAQYSFAVWNGSVVFVAFFGPDIILSYDPAADAWQTVPLPPFALGFTTSAIAIGAKLYLLGGGPSSGPLKSAALYDPAAGTWTQQPDYTLTPSTNQYAAVWAPTTGEVIAWGGVDPTTGLLAGAAYKPSSQTWRTLAPVPMAVQGAANGNAAALRPVWAGSGLGLFTVVPSCGDAGTDYCPGALYDPVSDTWSSWDLPPYAVGMRGGAATAVSDASQFAVWTTLAGQVTTDKGSGGLYAGGAWSQLPVPPAAALRNSGRSQPFLWWGAGHLYMWGGYVLEGGSGLSVPAADGAWFDPATQSWTAIPTVAGGPAGANGYSGFYTPGFVWTGTDAIFVYALASQTGWIYRP